MTLRELCEPLFQYVCRLNRSARKGGILEMALVRAELRSMVDQLRTKAGLAPGLHDQYQKVEKPIVFFVDSMIYSSKISWAKQWQPLAEELWGERGGDEKFFNLLDTQLADKSPSASDPLEVFYTCLGLGFSGFYTGQPEFLRRKMLEIEARLGARMDFNPGTRIVPDDQLNVFAKDLTQPPSRLLSVMVLVLIGLVIALVLSNVLLFHYAQTGLSRDLTNISHVATRNLPVATKGPHRAVDPDSGGPR